MQCMVQQDFEGKLKLNFFEGKKNVYEARAILKKEKRRG